MRLSAKIGAIEIAQGEVRVAVVATGGKFPRVLDLSKAKVTYANEEERLEAVVIAIREAIDDLKNRPTVFILCVSSAWAVVRQLTIPFRGKRRVSAAVRFELEPYLAFPIEDLVVDHLPVREVDGQTEVLTIGVRKAVIEEQLAVLDAAGISAEGVGIDAIGMTALWHAQRKTSSGLEAVLHVRDEGSILAVMRDKKIAFVRHLAAASARLHENPQSAAREVTNMLRAFNAGAGPGEEISKLTLTGAKLFDEERALFEDDLGVSVEYVNLLAPVKFAKNAKGNLADDANLFAGPVGVAHAASGGAFFLNFLRDDLAANRVQRGVAAHAVLTGVLALALFMGYMGYAIVDYRRNLDALDSIGQLVWEEYVAAYPDADTAQSRPAGDIGGFRSADLMHKAVEEESQQRKTLSVDMFTQPTLLAILKELAAHMPDDKVGLTDMKITVGKNSEITISGEVKDSVEFSAVMTDLRTSTAFDVDPNPQRRSVGGKETFTIKANR